MKRVDNAVKALRQTMLDALNRYGQPLSVDELVLENLLAAVREQMARETDEAPDSAQTDARRGKPADKNRIEEL